jgi:hypothetical protein
MNDTIKKLDDKLKEIHIKYGYVTACNDVYDTLKVLESKCSTTEQLLYELRRELLLLNISK